MNHGHQFHGIDLVVFHDYNFDLYIVTDVCPMLGLLRGHT